MSNVKSGKAMRLRDLEASVASDNIVKSKYSWWPFNTHLITKLTYEKILRGLKVVSKHRC